MSTGSNVMNIDKRKSTQVHFGFGGFFFWICFVLLFVFERERVQVGDRGKERENTKQAPR